MAVVASPTRDEPIPQTEEEIPAETTARAANLIHFPANCSSLHTTDLAGGGGKGDAWPP